MKTIYIIGNQINRISFANFILAIVIVWAFSSCEDVITLDLKTSDPQFVVESTINEGNGPFSVKISKSGNYYTQGEYPAVSGASVTISDNDGNSELLTSIGNGVYKTKKINGKQGLSYYLNVQAEGKEIIATTTMPSKVAIDSLDFEYGQNPHYKGYMVNLYFHDPGQVQNYYRVIIYRNGKPYKDKENGNEIILFEDKFTDGKDVRVPVKQGGQFFDLNDTIRVDFVSLDKATYEYFKALTGAITSGGGMMKMGKSMMEGSAAPANPENNLSYNVLGYFTAVAVSSKEIVIK